MLKNLKAPQGRHTFSPGRKTWDQCSNIIEALKGRHILRALGWINMSPLQGLIAIAIETRRSRVGLKVFRPFRAKISPLHIFFFRPSNSSAVFFLHPPAVLRLPPLLKAKCLYLTGMAAENQLIERQYGRQGNCVLKDSLPQFRHGSR